MRAAFPGRALHFACSSDALKRGNGGHDRRILRVCCYTNSVIQKCFGISDLFEGRSRTGCAIHTALDRGDLSWSEDRRHQTKKKECAYKPAFVARSLVAVVNDQVLGTGLLKHAIGSSLLRACNWPLLFNT